MEYIDILGFAGIVIGLIGFLSIGNIKRRLVLLSAVICLLVYCIIKPIYPFAVIMTVAMIYLFYEFYKLKKSKSSINLVEVESDDNYITEFIKTYKKDIYNYFPFYQPQNSHKCFLLMRDLNLAGIIIASINDDIMTIEVDYAKPSYRDKEIGRYIYVNNPGFFKKFGVNKILAKSFHKGHSKFLLRMGFKQSFFDNQQFFIKNLD